MEAFIFYMFSTVLILSALKVVSARNPVHAVLFLVLCFFNAAGLFLMLGAEFIAFILLIVYVGAVAVLFLFVVMMLDINFEDVRHGLGRNMLAGGTVAGVLMLELVGMAGAWTSSPRALVAHYFVAVNGVDNTRAIGRLLYTDYFFPFQVSGLILLVAMIGAIVLAMHHRKDARRQSVSQQLDRPIGDVIEIHKVKPGQGVKL